MPSDSLLEIFGSTGSANFNFPAWKSRISVWSAGRIPDCVLWGPRLFAEERREFCISECAVPLGLWSFELIWERRGFGSHQGVQGWLSWVLPCCVLCFPALGSVDAVSCLVHFLPNELLVCHADSCSGWPWSSQILVFTLEFCLLVMLL